MMYHKKITINAIIMNIPIALVHSTVHVLLEIQIEVCMHALLYYVTCGYILSIKT